MPNKLQALTLFVGSVAAAYAVRPSSPLAAIAPGDAPVAPAQKKLPVTPPVVIAVELHLAPTLLVQPCPGVLVFHGEITTARPTSVTYTWVDSRGRTGPEHHRRLLAGVSAVNHKWRVGHPGRTVDEWVQLKIISPESRTSARVPVHFTCAK